MSSTEIDIVNLILFIMLRPEGFLTEKNCEEA
jgi:hypothetical protein